MGGTEHNVSLFHPLVHRWFNERVGSATDVQLKSWPKIASGQHALITAPTGSGKTLTAFLWALNQLITGQYPSGCTGILYISPLKALNNDIQRNLLKPLDELESTFVENNQPFPKIRVATRSGDTDQTDRRRMLRHPPEILITTPESLNLMLSSQNSRSILSSVATVILDEIHSVVESKRGVHLITAVDRLVPLAGEFQRIALSATIKPLPLIAEFLGGYQMRGSPQNPVFKARPVSVIKSGYQEKYDVSVLSPPTHMHDGTSDSFWKALVEGFKEIISRNQTTLLFANSRALAEKISFKINIGEKRPLAYAHHGSLSKEIREDVEAKLKAGELKAVVATSSLEMGIDIGAVDEVILIQAPASMSSTIQRIGRASHQVDQKSRGIIFPTHPQDFIESAVLAKSVMDLKIEEVHPIMCSLDILAQIVISMTGTEVWDIDRLYHQLRTSYVYHELKRKHFDLVLNMLAGRYHATRIRDLKPRIVIDHIDGTVQAKKGALLDLYLSGGSIPDRGNYRLIHHESDARIGDLDEEFVWEAKIGQVFTLGTQNWKIQRITHNDVFVIPASPNTIAAPFWRAEELNRNFQFSEQIAEFLEYADNHLSKKSYEKELRQEHFMSPDAVQQLTGFLIRQKEATMAALPHRHHLLIEYSKTGPESSPGNQVILHTMWGGCVNRPFALALDAAWEEKYGHRSEIFAGNDCIVFILPHEVAAAEILSLVTIDQVEKLLRNRLEGSGFFGARFRECAARALLLTKQKFNERLPLWMSRLRSQKLMESVFEFDNFPVLLETWRTCLNDEFDLKALRLVLTELEQGVIRWSETTTSQPSPMGKIIAFRQISKYMYMDDSPLADRSSQLNTDLLKEVIFNPESRPAISEQLIQQFELKRQRLFPGYSPSSALDLLDWIKERVLLPQSEWRVLKQAIEKDHEVDLNDWLSEISDKVIRVIHSQTDTSVIIARERLEDVIELLELSSDALTCTNVSQIPIDPRALVNLKQPIDRELNNHFDNQVKVMLEWLSFYGPLKLESVIDKIGLAEESLLKLLDALIASKQLIVGCLIDGSDDSQYCDSQCFETLLRMNRKDSVPAFKTLELDCLQPFLAQYHHFGNHENTVDGLFQALEQLNCYETQAELWESDILPARFSQYSPNWLDEIIQESDFMWKGGANKKITFYFNTDSDLLHTPPINTDNTDQKSLFPDNQAKYDFSTLMRLTSLKSTQLNQKLWERVWQGDITNDSMTALRKGIQNKFKIERVPTSVSGKQSSKRRRQRSGFSKWKTRISFTGNWYLIPQVTVREDLLENEEIKKERARLVLDRYGIVFRELLLKERPEFQWSSIFRSLRLMELSGEITSGCFFHGVPGLQFISHHALRILRQKKSSNHIFWINACDPMSLAGSTLKFNTRRYPKRFSQNYLVFRGKERLSTILKGGKEINFHIGENDKAISESLQPIHHLLHRSFQPKRHIAVETINEVPASKSPYLGVFQTVFNTMIEYKKITLYRNIS